MKISVLVVMFVFCAFMGVTAISMGLGAAFPSINLIAKPLVCSGELHSSSELYKPYPGKNVLTRSWYCTDATGNTTEVGMFPMSLYAGFIYGLALFSLVYVLMWRSSKRIRA